MSKWNYLSHPWGPSCPTYGNGPRSTVVVENSICCGKSSNSLRFESSNHVGTHFDFPLHFDSNGKSLMDYPPEFFVYHKVAILWLEKPFGEFIDLNSFENFACVGHPDPELLLVRTGAAARRSDPDFGAVGLGVGAGVADYIRQKFPNCRTLGIDSISLSSYANRELGRQVHKEFLKHPKPIPVIEDMNLEILLGCSNISKVIALPLRIENGDGAPCTVIVEFS